MYLLDKFLFFDSLCDEQSSVENFIAMRLVIVLYRTLQLDCECSVLCSVECEKQINVELARVIRVLRAKYGAEPVTELAKGGVDVARILQFMG